MKFSLFTLCLLVSFQTFATEKKSCLLFNENYKLKPSKNTAKSNAPSTIDADYVTKKGSITTFNGSVILLDKDTTIKANQAVIDKTQGTDIAEFTGNVELNSLKNNVKSNKIIKKINGEKTLMSDAFFINHKAKIRGFAKEIDNETSHLSNMTDMYFTSCPPEKEDWRVRSKSITLNQETQQGTAKDIILEFKDVPIFYSPFFFFALGNDRLSGFLTPGYTTSSRNGVQLAIPYYFNIAPNLDNTLTVKTMEFAGVALNNNTRFLTKNSYWELDSEYLNNDNIINKERYYAHLKQSARFDWFRMNMDITTASDKDYLADFSNQLLQTNKSHLKQSVSFYTPIANKDANISFLSYQTLDQSIADTSRPYQLLPRVNYKNSIKLTDFDINYQTQWSNFYRKASTVGHRFHVKPSIQKNYSGNAWAVSPKVSLDLTQYELTTAANTNLSLSRALPIVSVDSHLFLEKNVNSNTMQILEPRLYYLYVPFQDQSAIPNFDTSKNTFNMSQLFRENSFSGIDKIQNANQLTSSISFREVDLATGKNKYKLQAGVISYFEQPQVPLTTETLSTFSDSNMLFQWDGYFPNKVVSQYFIQYDQKKDVLVKQTAYIRYNNNNKIINSTWSKETNKEQLSLSGYWPITQNWQIIGRHDYSIIKDQEILSILGFEYDNCCFQFRISYKRTPVVNTTDFNESTTFQLVFKSLSEPSLGIGKTWQQNITGYTDPYQQ